jgi:adenylylsulfate kinase
MNQGFVIWLTGLPGSGKTTIAKLLLGKLKEDGILAVHLESDVLRMMLTPDPTYSYTERDRFYSVLVSMGKLLSEQGVNVVLDATANLRKHRDEMRGTVSHFVEVYVRCPLEICVRRDPKGLYAAAKEGKTKTVPGIQEPYEESDRPEVVVDSDRIPAEQAAEKIRSYVSTTGWIS